MFLSIFMPNDVPAVDNIQRRVVFFRDCSAFVIYCCKKLIPILKKWKRYVLYTFFWKLRFLGWKIQQPD